MFPAWEGTPWSFYGQSWEPRQGSIACGYFVTTALHDSGLLLPRTLLAKQTATTIIKNLTSESYITRYRGLSPADFIRRVRQLGPGLYVLGRHAWAWFDAAVGALTVPGVATITSGELWGPRGVVPGSER